MDINQTGILTFRDLSYLLGILLKGDAVNKVSLFYKLHIPPAFNMSDIDDILNRKSFDDDEPEVGVEAATVVGSAKSSPAKVVPNRKPSRTLINEVVSGVDETAVDAASEADEFLSSEEASGGVVYESPTCSSHPSSINLEFVGDEAQSVKFSHVGSPLSDDFSLPERAPSEISDSFSLVEDANDAIKSLSQKMQQMAFQEAQKRTENDDKPVESITQVSVIYFS